MPFIFYFDEGRGRYATLPDDRLYIFGRADEVDFQILEDPDISREHFGIERDEKGNFVVIDLGSTNGTFLNGERLSNELAVLSDMDIIRAGAQRFIFKTRDDMDEQTARDHLGDGPLKITPAKETLESIIRKLKRGQPGKNGPA